MSHKDAKPLSEAQKRFEDWWVAYKGPGFVGFGRDKHSEYLAEFAKDAWAAWQAAEGYKV